MEKNKYEIEYMFKMWTFMVSQDTRKSEEMPEMLYTILEHTKEREEMTVNFDGLDDCLKLLPKSLRKKMLKDILELLGIDMSGFCGYAPKKGIFENLKFKEFFKSLKRLKRKTADNQKVDCLPVVA